MAGRFLTIRYGSDGSLILDAGGQTLTHQLSQYQTRDWQVIQQGNTSPHVAQRRDSVIYFHRVRRLRVVRDDQMISATIQRDLHWRSEHYLIPQIPELR